MQVTLGAEYEVKTGNGGTFTATADRFERDGNEVVLVPTEAAVRDVFPQGYRLGQAHWAHTLTQLG